MNTFSLKVIACDRVFFDGRCEQVVLPLHDGEKAIQAHHENMVFAVEIGEDPHHGRNRRGDRGCDRHRICTDHQ